MISAGRWDVWYFAVTVFMSWEFLFFWVGQGGKWAFCLCLGANSNGEHSEKWNKSSYFKVVVKVSQLIELDCGYCVLLTSSLDLNKQNNFKPFPSNTKPSSWDVMLSASVHLYYISPFLIAVFFLWVCLTCKYMSWVYTVLCILDTPACGVSHFGLPLYFFHPVGYTTDDLQFMWQTGDPVQMDAIALPQFDIRQEDIDYGNCTKFYSGTGTAVCYDIFLNSESKCSLRKVPASVSQK